MLLYRTFNLSEIYLKLANDSTGVTGASHHSFTLPVNWLNLALRDDLTLALVTIGKHGNRPLRNLQL